MSTERKRRAHTTPNLDLDLDADDSRVQSPLKRYKLRSLHHRDTPLVMSDSNESTASTLSVASNTSTTNASMETLVTAHDDGSGVDSDSDSDAGTTTTADASDDDDSIQAARFYGVVPGSLLHKYSNGILRFDATAPYPSAGAGAAFDATWARKLYPAACSNPHQSFVPYLMADEYLRLELVVALLELVLPDALATTTSMDVATATHLVDLLYMLVGKNRYIVCSSPHSPVHAGDVSTASENNNHDATVANWWRDDTFVASFQRIQRFVWSHGIGVLEELILEVPRMFTTRACGRLAEAALRIRNYTTGTVSDHKLPNTRDTTPMFVHTRALNQDPAHNPLLQLFSKCDADPLFVFRCNSLRLDFTIATELLHFACHNLVSMGIRCIGDAPPDRTAADYEAPVITITRAFDLITVLEDRREAMTDYIMWLGTLSVVHNVQIRVLNPENMSDTESDEQSHWCGSLSQLLCAMPLPSSCFFDLLTQDMHSNSAFGIKLYRLYATVCADANYSSLWGFLAFLGSMNPSVASPLWIACTDLRSNIKYGGHPRTQVNRDVVRHIVLGQHPCIDSHTARSMARLVLELFDSTAPTWDMMPHVRTAVGTSRELQDVWRIDDVYLAVRCINSGCVMEPEVEKRIGAMCSTWIAPVGRHWHICIGDVDHRQDECMCGPRLSELHAWLMTGRHMLQMLEESRQEFIEFVDNLSFTHDHDHADDDVASFIDPLPAPIAASVTTDNAVSTTSADTTMGDACEVMSYIVDDYA